MHDFKKHLTISGLFAAALLLSLSCMVRHADLSDPLPSWNEGATKKAIIDFVTAVTTEGTPSWVAPEDRVATFDNDGTLWAEKPLVQGMFVRHIAGEQVDNIAPEELEHEMLKLFVTAQSGMTLSEYHRAVADFFANATTPSGKTMSQLRYRPQLELLDYLRDNGFTIYICSGGTVDFIRVISEEYYGVPSERVIGTEFEYTFDYSLNDFVRSPRIHSFNDKAQKPVSIQYHIGKRPILACGNVGGAGDIDMLRFSRGNAYPSLQLIVNHDDAEREFFYGEENNESLNRAAEHGWCVVSIKNDWKEVFTDE